MLLTITEIGHQRETEALASGYFPRVESVAIGDGVPHADPKAATALVHQVLRVPISVVERVSAQAVRFHATIPQGQTFTIREFGLILEDGTLYGYLPYETVTGSSLHKHASFAFSFSLAISREALPPIEVKYSPVDTGEIAENINQQTQQRVDGWLTDGLSSILSEGAAQIAAIKREGADQQSALLDLGRILFCAYESRGDLRFIEEKDRAVVDGLGLFVWVSGSDEPDDDESCFATQNGRWLLEAAHWDVVDAWQLPDVEVRDEFDKDSDGRLTSAEGRWPGRILFGTANQTITSLASVTQTSFNTTIIGAMANDHVIVTPPTALGERISVFARVTAANTVTIYLNNPSAAAQSLPTGTWRVAVIQES